MICRMEGNPRLTFIADARLDIIRVKSPRAASLREQLAAKSAQVRSDVEALMHENRLFLDKDDYTLRWVRIPDEEDILIEIGIAGNGKWVSSPQAKNIQWARWLAETGIGNGLKTIINRHCKCRLHDTQFKVERVQRDETKFRKIGIRRTPFKT